MTSSRLADNVTLTGTAAASTAVTVAGNYHHTLYVNYKPDTDDTNAMVFTIETSPDGTTWHPFGAPYTLTGAVTEIAQMTVTDDSGAAAEQPLAPIVFDCHAYQIRMKASESNTPAAYGEYDAMLFSSL
jgi:hypothetical protein